MNKFICIGRWSKPVELKATPSGKYVATSTLAINEGYGEKKTTTFLPVVLWGKTAEVAAEYSKTGDLVSIEGRVSVRSWEKDGQKRYQTEIVGEHIEFLQSKKSANSSDKSHDPFSADSRTIDISDDDLPF